MRLRRTKSLVLVLTVLVLAAVATFLWLDLWWRHERTMAAARTRAARLSLAVSAYVRGAFAAADTSLVQLALHGQHIGGAEAPASEWLPLLEAAHAALPGSGSLSVTDARGVVRHSTLGAIVGQGRENSYAFKYLAEHDPARMLVDEPLLSPVNGRYVLPVSRRLETPDGRFAGIVVCVVAPDLFREFFKTLDVGAQGIVWVLHPNGIVLFRGPSAGSPLGERAATNPIVVSARTAADGVLTGPLEQRGGTFVSAFHALATPPLVVAVSLNRDDVLADWRAQRRLSVIAFAIFATVVGSAVTLAFRQIDARSKVERALVEAQRLEAERLREANDRLAEALDREKQARDDSEAASRMKDEFLMTLSHELRTPLNAVLGWTRMLASGALPAGERDRALTTIERNAQAQARLVEELLDVSRAISGKLQLQPQPLNVPEVVAGAVETLTPAVAAKGLEFTMDVGPDIPIVRADAERLQQVVWNLLSNAIKFTPGGGEVRLEVRSTSDGVRIAVRDTGAGIAPAFLPYVFERFRQADTGPRRESGGLGLGLAISRHLVELHGGTIKAESAGEGQGATFTVDLPISAVAEGGQPARAGHRRSHLEV